MRAIQITEFGGPEVLQLADVYDPTVGANEFLLDVSHAGVNYADTHQAENSYLSAASLPLIPGGEVVGTDETGRRFVCLTDGGGYAERAAVSRFTSYEVPNDIDDLTALAMIVQGTTAWLLLRKSTHMAYNESVVVHAAAGGVGSIAVQLAKAWGAGRIIATASSESKRELALELGADVAIDSNSDNMTMAIRESNEGRGVDVILDMTGGRITDESVRALAPFGRLAFYGQASRQAPKPIAPTSLLQHSTTIAGMWLPHAFRLPGDIVGLAMTELFELAEQGRVRAIPGGEFPLAGARSAHEALRSRKTVGKLLLNPNL
ncbi:MAG: quinone oxidoreductase family protein [Candidatus Nanopelagicales bacterium]